MGQLTPTGNRDHGMGWYSRRKIWIMDPRIPVTLGVSRKDLHEDWKRGRKRKYQCPSNYESPSKVLVEGKEIRFKLGLNFKHKWPESWRVYPRCRHCCSVTQSCPALCELQHARLPCPLPSPRVCLEDSCFLSQWCHPTISSSVVPFSYCPQVFPELMWQRRSAFICLSAVIREKWNHFKEGSACCSPWGHKESDTTEWLNWTENHFMFVLQWVQIVQ